MKPSSPAFQLPERLCMLWSGFFAFVVAFIFRLLASGSPAEAVFSASLACLAGGFLGRWASHYVNVNLREHPGQGESDAVPEQAQPADTRA